MPTHSVELPIAVHPGDILREMLDEAGVSQSALARHLHTDVARINHKGGRDWSMDASSDVVADVLRRARGKQKAVVGMKLFGAGRMTKAADREASLRWVLEQGLVDALTIGTTSTDQIDANLDMIAAIRGTKG